MDNHSISDSQSPVFKPDFDVVIVGGGLAGLTAAIILAKANKNILLVEKNSYPFHRVCGEYVSNEVLDYLLSLGFDPFAYGASTITKLRISTPSGKNVYTPLDLGGFGISRCVMDEALYRLALQYGATIHTNTRVVDVQFLEGHFKVSVMNGIVLTARVVIGCYGKREMLDKKLERSFINKRTGYMAVKYHIRTDYPLQEIGLDNFNGGYCGISKIEGDRYNLCYLYRRPQSNDNSSIAELEKNVLQQNPVLRRLFTESEFLFKEPKVISEIFFDRKTQIEDHILMCGDTAGLITPLCGNGMSMAISGAELLTTLILKSNILNTRNPDMDVRHQLEQEYQLQWNVRFARRLWWGRKLQPFFGRPLLTKSGLFLLSGLPALRRKLVSLTHGQPI